MAKLEREEYGACEDCGKILHISEMSERFRIWLCPDCRLERRRKVCRKWYAENKEKVKAKTREREKKQKAENPGLYRAIHSYFAMRREQREKAEDIDAFRKRKREYMREYLKKKRQPKLPSESESESD